jgi:gamma-glutamyl-gamma-aminobutyrate hydrolase PuuD
VNHEAGRKVAVAHSVEIVCDSRLARVLGGWESTSGAKAPIDEELGIAALEALGHLKPGHESKAANDTKVRSDTRAMSDPGPLPGSLVIPVNSSHHQSAEAIGDGLRIVARCPDDGIIEALEGIAPDHFVLAVQWHPERSVEEDAVSRAIFDAMIVAARRH